MKLAIVAALSALIAAPSFAQTAASEIEKANNRFEHALNAGDAATIARMYTDRAVVMPPKAEMIGGRQAILDYWRGVIAAGVKNLSLQSLRIDEYGGNAASEIGRFGAEVPAPAGQSGAVEGKYVTVWRKSGSDWQHDSDIWNFTEPSESDGAFAAPGPENPSPPQ